ncbi:MAG: phosphopyruvate hydratase [Isosphaeraceae bacterium]|nr:phosphopyruvate hydratase [Isosphaeraceae bacterium]
MSTLAKLKAREVFDSRGRPTVEVEATTDGGAVGRAIVPSGASTGRHEALELRDGDCPQRHSGRGVLRAVKNVQEEIAAAVVGIDLDDQAGLDAKLVALDGTPNKGRLGGNAVLGVSLAVAHAAAAARGEELFVTLNRLWRERLGPGEDAEPVLPLPMVNMISGGLHAGANLDFQDFLFLPIGAGSYSDALETTVCLYHALGQTLKEKGHLSALVGDEGGYGPRLRTNAQAVDVILEAALACDLKLGRDVAIALDVAASHWHDPATGTYRLSAAGDETLDTAGMIALLEHWVKQYPILSIEDGLAEDDWDGWRTLTERLGASVQLIGDDLFATQPERLRLGIERGAANAILIKLNQVGTLSETFDALLLARKSGYRTIVSARSGETEDTTIADLAVATAAGQIKIGSVARSERLAKYNRLLRIEEILGGPARARYAGRAALRV